eukprot:NODE_4_length_77007_cov_1.156642.p25 type:complete len:334 gc:universal NODE_4_length_77007_cov_1.156642:42639-41638(-)
MDGKIIQAGKFDNRSTAEERETFLRGLLELDRKQDNVGDTQDDEELNEMLARNEHELDFFRKMDHERQSKDDEEWQRNGNQGSMPSRLMTFEELPEAYKSEFNPLSLNRTDDPDVFGRAAKKRQVNYDDTMTEEEYVDKMIEDDSNPMTPKRRAAARATQPLKKQKLENNHISRFALDLIDAIESEMDNSEDYDRQRAYLFLSLPSRVDYPTYYIQIKRPISIAEIKKRIGRFAYISLDDVAKDLKLMFDNARIFNIEGSQVYDDANFLEILTQEKIVELKALMETEIADENAQKLVDEQLSEFTESTQSVQEPEPRLVIIDSDESSFAEDSE